MIRSVSLQAGAKEYQIRFSFNAVCSLEEKMGKSIDQLTGELQENFSFILLRNIVWAGLLDKHGEALTLKQVGEIIDEAGLTQTSEAVMKAINGMMPTPSGDGAASVPTNAARVTNHS